MRRVYGVLSCLVMLCLVYGGYAQESQSTLAEVIASDERFTTLRYVLEHTDSELVTWLENPENQLTVLAPTNDAFDHWFGNSRMSVDRYIEMYADDSPSLLRYYVIPARIDFEKMWRPLCDAVGTMRVNQPIFMRSDDDTLFLNQMVQPGEPLAAVNGVVYPIERMLPVMNLIPSAGDHSPDAEYPVINTNNGGLEEIAVENSAPEVRAVLEADGRFTTLLRLLELSPDYTALLSSDGLYTLAAPTDVAFEAFFTSEGIPFPALSAEQAENILRDLLAPGYVHPDYLQVFTQWNGRLNLCSFHSETYRMADSGRVQVQLDGLPIDVEETTITMRGAVVAGDALTARNAIIYPVDGVPHVSFRG